MQGRKDFTDKEVVHFRLSERVPPHNLYRRLVELVDWTFLYDETRALYSHTGQPWPWLKGWSRSRIYQVPRPGHVPESHLECVYGILIA